jgi:hypothetical protein
VYNDSKIPYFGFCTYDNEGDLFASGSNQYYASNLFELPEGSSSFTDISLNQSLTAGSIQWSGGGLAAAALNGNHDGKQAIYQIQISGSTGTISGPTLLWSRRDRRNRDEVQFWVQGGTIVGPDYNKGLELWRYPKGGRPKKVISATVLFYGITVSVSRHG